MNPPSHADTSSIKGKLFRENGDRVNCYRAFTEETTELEPLIAKLKSEIKKGQDTGIVKILSAENKINSFE